MSVVVEPLSLEVKSTGEQRYKSITNLIWKDIPGLTLLTGRNGSGKTQLLEVLAYYLSGALPPGTKLGAPFPVQVGLSGAIPRAEEVAYVPSIWRFSGGSPVSIGNITQARQQVIQAAQQYSHQGHSPQHDVTTAIRNRKWSKYLNGKNVQLTTPDQLIDVLPDSYDFMIDDLDVTSGLNYVFVAHRAKMLEALERNTPGWDVDGKSLGPAPWDIVNQSLQAAGFPYDVKSPIHTKISDNYELELLDKSNRLKIKALDLSSGEKVILQVVLWLFSSSKPGVFPKLLLLDEPDAHLHPSMTVQFLNVISDILVERYGVRVIMTTHSPSTVALAPNGSVFEMKRGVPLITKLENKADIISILTSGILTVSRSTKYCFVEDDDDVEFYSTLYEVLSDYGPSKDPCALSTSPSIVFIPVSVGAGSTKVGGGCTIIEKWVFKLDTNPLNVMFVGIIDRDKDNKPTYRIFVLGRYSFENYLLDPVNIFCCLLEEGVQAPVDRVSISSGNEHLIRTQSNDHVQLISDKICSVMEDFEPGLKTGKLVDVVYTGGIKIKVDSWVRDKRGHDILPLAQKAFAYPKVLTPPRLLKAIRRGRMIPVELAKLLAEIQSF